MNFIRQRIENYKQSRLFTAQNCLTRQTELKNREEKRKIAEDQRRLQELIDEIENRIRYVISQSFNQQTVIFQVNEGDEDMFSKAKDYFISNGFNAFFQQMDNLPVTALVISWM